MAILQRTAVVDDVKIDSVGIASVLQIGDSTHIRGYSRAFAVQREAEIYFGNEGNLAEYSVFNEPIPLLPITENVTVSRHNLNPYLKVRSLDIHGVSTSSIVHLGNTKHVSLEARIKHIRQLLPH